MRVAGFILYICITFAPSSHASCPFDLLDQDTKSLLNNNIASMIDGLTKHMNFPFDLPSDPKLNDKPAAPYELRLNLLAPFINIILSNKEGFESHSWKTIHRFFEENLKTLQPPPELEFNYETVELFMSLLLQTGYLAINTASKPAKYRLISGTALENARLLYQLTLPQPPKVVNNTKKKKRKKKKRPHTSDAAE